MNGSAMSLRKNVRHKMQQYFINRSDLNPGDLVTLSVDDSHHIVRVMRGREGDKLGIIGGQQRFDGQIERITDDQLVEAVILERLAVEYYDIELPVEVTIACGLSKNDKLDTIVQKATECGMSHFIPLAMKRDIVQWTTKKSHAKIERLAKIAKGAAEQSHRLHIPTIDALMTLPQLLEKAVAYDVILVAYEETAKEGQHAVLAEVVEQLTPGQKVLVVFGSEGGLDPSEIQTLTGAGFKTCSLGPRILRAETAPIYLLSALSFGLELQKNK